MKNLLDWNYEFETGIPLIDNQNKRFLNTTKGVQSMILTIKKESMVDLFSFIYDYIISYFKQEEAFMVSCEYPDIDEHVEQHREFKKKIDAFYDSYKNNNTFIIVNIINFMKDWIIGHILSSDKAIGNWYIKSIYYKKL